MRPAQVFISYAHADERLRQSLMDQLAALRGEGLIDAWHDRKITAGEEWAGAIDANLEQADIILLLVSASFLASAYCSDIELRRALERHERGEARVIPVILKPALWENSAFAKLQALPGNGKAITSFSNRDAALKEVAEGIRQVALELAQRPGRDGDFGAPPAPVAAPLSPPSGAGAASPPDPAVARLDPAVAREGQTSAALEIPEGPVRHDSPFYIHPVDEARCFAELEKPGALIRIKSPKGFGKSSLNARLLAHASSKGYRTVALNLESTDQKFFENPDRFMQWFCAAVGKGLGLRVRTEEYWDNMFGANDNSTDYFETYLLKPDATPLVLAIDNFDRVFAHAAIEVDFCGLLRSWHERARSNPLWEGFRLVLSHSQESYLQKDINQSPFNVGLPIELGELPPPAVASLAELHGLGLGDAELGQLRELVGGHPYLVRKALYELANGLPLATFLREAPTEAGVYGDHLRGILKAVEDHPDLAEGLQQVVASAESVKLRSEQAFKLESLGVVVPAERNMVRPRCRLYATYLADRLGG